MQMYQLEVEIKSYKADEFINSTHSILPAIRKQKGCLQISVYRDSEMENAFVVEGGWKTRQAMDRHFKTAEFELLIGAARVLGKTFSMSICGGLKRGGFDLARKQITSSR